MIQDLLNPSNVLSALGIVVGVLVSLLTARGTSRLLDRSRYHHAKLEIVNALSVSLGEGTAPSERIVAAAIRSVLREQGLEGKEALEVLRVKDVMEELLYRVTANQFLESSRRSELQKVLVEGILNIESFEMIDRESSQGNGANDSITAYRSGPLRSKVRYTALGLGVVVGALTLLGFVSVARASFEGKPDVSSSELISPVAPSEVWFAPDGRLISIENEGVCVILTEWEPGLWNSRSTLVNFEDRRAPRLDTSQDEGLSKARSSCVRRPLAKLPLYAISRDASAIVWLEGDVVLMRLLSLSKGEGVSLFADIGTTEDQLASMAFIEGRIALLYKDGNFEVVSPGSMSRGGAYFGDAWSILAIGEKDLVLASSVGGDYAVVDLRRGEVVVTSLVTTDEKPVVEASVDFRGCASVVESSGSRVLQTCQGKEAVILEAPPRVGTLASLAEGELLAGTDLGLYLLKRGHGFQKLESEVWSGPLMLVSRGQYLAYATYKGLFAGEIRERLVINQSGQRNLLILSLAISAVLFMAVLFESWGKLRLLLGRFAQAKR